MSFTETLLFHTVELFLTFQKDLELRGPLFLDRPQDRELVSRAIKFRTQQNLLRAPWLESPAQLELEAALELDRRSAHFIALRNGEIMVTQRLTPGPFELSALAPKLSQTNLTHHGYWEYSRLCTKVDLERKGFFAQLLLIKAGAWLFAKTDAQGIVAVCQQEKLPYMANFALYSEGAPFNVAGRQGAYSFITAPREKVLSRFMREYLGRSENQTEDRQIS